MTTHRRLRGDHFAWQKLLLRHLLQSYALPVRTARVQVCRGNAGSGLASLHPSRGIIDGCASHAERLRLILSESHNGKAYDEGYSHGEEHRPFGLITPRSA